MACRLSELVLECHDAESLARFWCEVLDIVVLDRGDTDGTGDLPAYVTMYVGNGQMVNAPSTGINIRVESLEGPYYPARLMSTVRFG